MSRWEALDLAWQNKDTAWVWEYVAIYDLVSPGTRVLDVGCGDGVLGGRLKEAKNCDIIGMDMSQEAISIHEELIRRREKAGVQEK